MGPRDETLASGRIRGALLSFPSNNEAGLKYRSSHQLGLNLLTAETVDTIQITDKLTGREHCKAPTGSGGPGEGLVVHN